jgi:hypothetical protein
MQEDVVLTLTRRHLRWLAVGLLVVLSVFVGTRIGAQKVQDDYSDKFKISDVGYVSVAASADGQYVFVAGKKGVIVSDDHGKTGSWVQTLRMK